ncbi:MAG: quinone-dependent dihydroorotate dehydrogenase [Psychrosphaera sp.]|nr:quinone-dependent dihydroorotate dehydrogenase [Psychrosphaera sp.]
MARSLLFRLDPETAHGLALASLSGAHRLGLTKWLGGERVEAPATLMGLTFPNRVGLAAGLDKNAEHLDALGALGFGCVEVGTVTPRPQAGNPRPRLFRVPERGAIINRMGFNNAGVDRLVDNVRKSRYAGVIGINIGKNKDTPNERGKDDYIECMRKVYRHATYITVNISSPNTPGLRELQYGDALDDLLGSLKSEQQDLGAKYHKKVPLLVKIAPDLDLIEIKKIAGSLIKNQIEGVIACNTTLDRTVVEGLKHAGEAGGLSGRPVQKPSLEVIEKLSEVLAGKLPIIGVGCIDSAQSAKDKLAAGASLVQIYTGFIYQGPGLIKKIISGL